MTFQLKVLKDQNCGSQCMPSMHTFDQISSGTVERNILVKRAHIPSVEFLFVCLYFTVIMHIHQINKEPFMVSIPSFLFLGVSLPPLALGNLVFFQDKTFGVFPTVSYTISKPFLISVYVDFICPFADLCRDFNFTSEVRFWRKPCLSSSEIWQLIITTEQQITSVKVSENPYNPKESE